VVEHWSQGVVERWLARQVTIWPSEVATLARAWIVSNTIVRPPSGDGSYWGRSTELHLAEVLPSQYSTTPTLHHSNTPPLHHSSTPPLQYSITPANSHPRRQCLGHAGSPQSEYIPAPTHAKGSSGIVWVRSHRSLSISTISPRIRLVAPQMRCDRKAMCGAVNRIAPRRTSCRPIFAGSNM